MLVRSITFIALLASPALAAAQDATTALNRTTMNGYAGTAAARRHEQRRQNVHTRDTSKSAETRKICSHLADYARKPGATPAKMGRLTSLCRQAGL